MLQEEYHNEDKFLFLHLLRIELKLLYEFVPNFHKKVLS